jgi:hypothetical protein
LLDGGVRVPLDGRVPLAQLVVSPLPLDVKTLVSLVARLGPFAGLGWHDGASANGTSASETTKGLLEEKMTDRVGPPAVDSTAEIYGPYTNEELVGKAITLAAAGATTKGTWPSSTVDQAMGRAAVRESTDPRVLLRQEMRLGRRRLTRVEQSAVGGRNSPHARPPGRTSTIRCPPGGAARCSGARPHDRERLQRADESEV